MKLHRHQVKQCTAEWNEKERDKGLKGGIPESFPGFYNSILHQRGRELVHRNIYCLLDSLLAVCRVFLLPVTLLVL